MPTSREAIVTQIDALLATVDSAHGRSRFDDLSDLGDTFVSETITRLLAAVERLAPVGSPYAHNLRSALKQYGPNNAYNIPILEGALRGLRADYEAGFLQKVEALVQADVFADFLEMAEHLLAQGYKDPAAVLIGGVLEEHLRQLCVRHGIPTAIGGRPKKADTLNADLAKGGAYNKIDQQAVTAWLALRNQAAHGKYSEYTKEQVLVLHSGVRDFAARHL